MGNDDKAGRTKSFRIQNAQIVATFELICKHLNLREATVFDMLMRKFIKENQDQSRLDAHLPAITNITIIQPGTVNVAIQAQIYLLRDELQRNLGFLKKAIEEKDPKRSKQWLDGLAQVIAKNKSIIQVAEYDPGTRDLLTQARVHLSMKKPSS